MYCHLQFYWCCGFIGAAVLLVLQFYWCCSFIGAAVLLVLQFYWCCSFIGAAVLLVLVLWTSPEVVRKVGESGFQSFQCNIIIVIRLIHIKYKRYLDDQCHVYLDNVSLWGCLTPKTAILKYPVLGLLGLLGFYWTFLRKLTFFSQKSFCTL